MVGIWFDINCQLVQHLLLNNLFPLNLEYHCPISFQCTHFEHLSVGLSVYPWASTSWFWLFDSFLQNYLGYRWLFLLTWSLDELIKFFKILIRIFCWNCVDFLKWVNLRIDNDSFRYSCLCTLYISLFSSTFESLIQFYALSDSYT